jgi:hypothetical protein
MGKKLSASFSTFSCNIAVVTNVLSDCKEEGNGGLLGGVDSGSGGNALARDTILHIDEGCTSRSLVIQ